jgi:hypothetical protein
VVMFNAFIFNRPLANEIEKLYLEGRVAKIKNNPTAIIFSNFVL